MALSFEAKKAVVKEMSEVAKNSVSAGIAEYSGLDVYQMTQLRKAALESNVFLKVVKNTLAKRAVENTDFECIISALTGQVVLGFSKDDPGAVARTFKKFVKDNKAFVVTGLAVSGSFVSASELDKIAKLPTKDEAISLAVALMLAPVEKLVRTFNEFPAKTTRVVAAVRDQKQ